MCELKDSGERVQFSTGAVRECTVSKGRFDLLPLQILIECLNTGLATKVDNCPIESVILYDVAKYIDRYKDTGNSSWLKEAAQLLVRYLVRVREFENEYAVIEALANHFEAGAKKYSENNWKKGIPLSVYVDSASRHLIKHHFKHTDEPHAIACLWNLFCGAWTVDKFPELNSYAQAKE